METPPSADNSLLQGQVLANSSGFMVQSLLSPPFSPHSLCNSTERILRVKPLVISNNSDGTQFLALPQIAAPNHSNSKDLHSQPLLKVAQKEEIKNLLLDLIGYCRLCLCSTSHGTLSYRAPFPVN